MRSEQNRLTQQTHKATQAYLKPRLSFFQHLAHRQLIRGQLHNRRLEIGGQGRSFVCQWQFLCLAIQI